MASKIKVDQLETADGSGTIALQNQLSGMTTASVPTLDYTKMPSGSIIQVVNTTTGSNGTIASNSDSYSDTGFLTGTITPLHTGSKIYVKWSGFHPHSNANNGNYGVRWRIYRQVAGGGFSTISSNVDGGIHQNGGGSGEWFDFSASTEVFDTPTYTSGQELQYKVYFRRGSGNSNHAYFNHMGGVGSGVSLQRKVTLMEIKG